MMEFPTPIPPAIPLPNTIALPEPVLIQPQQREFQWEPVPIYVEDVPNPIPAPKPRPNVSEDGKPVDADEKEQEQRQEEQSSDGQVTSENPDGSKPIPASGKPVDIKPPLDLVPEIAEIQVVELPIIGVEIPLPRTEILVTATTTAGVSSVVAVGGTLFATTLFRQLQPIFKTIFKTVLKKLAALRKQPPPHSWSRQRLIDRRKYVLKKQ